MEQQKAMDDSNNADCGKERQLRGWGQQQGQGGGGMGGMQRQDEDLSSSSPPGWLIQSLFDNIEYMTRNVTRYDNGTIVARTHASDPNVAAILQDHVEQMKGYVKQGWYVRRWDPFFVEIFDRHEEYTMEMERLDDGVEARLSSTSDCGQALIEAHTDVVSLFVSTGHQEAEKTHEVPAACLPNPPEANTGQEIEEATEVPVDEEVTDGDEEDETHVTGEQNQDQTTASILNAETAGSSSTSTPNMRTYAISVVAFLSWFLV